MNGQWHQWRSFEEEDEFPLEYSSALRSIATNNMLGDDDGDDDDADEEYMATLAMDVEI